MANYRTAIGLQDAENLLHTEPDLHVVIMDKRAPEGFREERWEKHRVQAHLRKHGAFLSGPEARKAHHGVLTEGDDGANIFIETRHT